MKTQSNAVNPSAIRPFATICSFAVPTTELDPDFVPSVSVCIGTFATAAEAKQAYLSLANHPALISAYQHQSMLESDYVGGVQ